MRRCGAAVLLGALLVTSACGGGGGSDGRPSEGDVSKALRKAGEDSLLGPAAKDITKAKADCIAKVLVDSKVSDRTLKKIVAADKDFLPSKADEAALSKAGPDLVRCVANK
ncbi:MAG: hypothetical protein J7518_04980 [Nocardioidaceae bacterium]|nr:hypothetical protein [Nocardioidaceae bacterium]